MFERRESGETGSPGPTESAFEGEGKSNWPKTCGGEVREGRALDRPWLREFPKGLIEAPDPSTIERCLLNAQPFSFFHKLFLPGF